MELIIILTVIIFLIGTVSIALPSKSSREISNLRLEASKLGFKIISSKLSTQSFKNKGFSLVCYQFKNETNIKEAHFIRDKDDLILYSPLKLKYSDGYDEMKVKLNKFSLKVHEIIYSKTLIAFLWEEKSGLEELKNISSSIKEL
ncbi:hypothetical protein N9J53_02220 [Gammaproteobacteria bacterium]|nr:hypothetical protein [Gammaproteobacteria bacterium]MDA9133800.1 hypothetical protein [Gammaproteobacteria bacterium]